MIKEMLWFRTRIHARKRLHIIDYKTASAQFVYPLAQARNVTSLVTICCNTSDTWRKTTKGAFCPRVKITNLTFLRKCCYCFHTIKVTLGRQYLRLKHFMTVTSVLLVCDKGEHARKRNWFKFSLPFALHSFKLWRIDLPFPFHWHIFFPWQ